jgi:hypothetical protein
MCGVAETSLTFSDAALVEPVFAVLGDGFEGAGELGVSDDV